MKRHAFENRSKIPSENFLTHASALARFWFGASRQYTKNTMPARASECFQKHAASFMLRRESGFTLLEMVVSLGIFSFLIVMTIGIVLGVSNAQFKVANIQAIQDNVRFSLELITKELRTGTNYSLTSYGAACGGVAGSEISFDTSLGEKRVYYLDGSTGLIMRITGGTNCFNSSPFTSEEITVERLKFSLRGADPGLGPEDGQPMITVSLSVKSEEDKFILESKMDLQTTVVQKLRDL